MCQLKNEGGRCAAHQPGYLGLKVLSSAVTGLDEQQVKHSYNLLRAKGKNMPTPTVEQYEEFVQSIKERTPSLAPDKKTKSRVIRQLDKKLDEHELPDGPTFYALQRLMESTHNQSKRIERTLEKFSEERGIDLVKVRAMYTQELEETVSPRKRKVNSQIDPRTKEALVRLHRGHPKRIEESPRISLTSVNRRCSISQAGYDPEDGRFEVEINGRTYAYRNVTNEQWAEFQNAPMRVFNEVRKNEDNQYETVKEAQLDAHRVWCESCSKFRLASGHVCRSTQSYEKAFKKVQQRLEKKARRSRSIEDIACPDWHRLWEKRRRANFGVNPKPEDVKKFTETSDLACFTLNVETTNAYKVQGHFVAGKASPNDITMELEEVQCPCPVFQRNRECEHTREAKQKFREYYQELDYDSAMRNSQMVFPYDIYAYRGSVPFTVTNEGLTDAVKKDIYYVVSTDNRKAVLYMDEKILRNDGRASGALNVSIENGSLQVIPQSLCSTCGEIDCTHIQQLTERYHKEIEEVVFTPSRRLEELNRLESSNFLRSPDDLGDNTQSTMYAKDLDAYIADMRAAENVVKNGGSPISFVEESVTEGRISSTTGQGRGFGVEIEYTVKNEEAAERIREEIATTLMEQGLSRDNEVHEYGMSSLHTDYSTWAVEDDMSVSGEVISPVLYDNKESWEQIRQVTDIIKKHGGTVDETCGQHVHVGISPRVTSKANVMSLVKEHQDSLRRAGTNPDRKKHRNSAYTIPQDAHTMQSLSYVMQGSNDAIRQMEVWGERDRTVNVANEETVEFRDADGTLDPAHIQAQVMLAAAVVAKAEKEPRFVERQGNTVGLNRKRTSLLTGNAKRTLTDEELIVSDVNYRSMIDSLFNDNHSKKTMIGLAAMNPWQEGLE